VGAVIRWLDSVMPEPDNRPPPIEVKEAMQRVTRQTAFEPETWTAERAKNVASLFDTMADGWNTLQSAVNRYEPLLDALERGDVGGRVALEVGSGTGLATPAIAARFATVVSLDLSREMLARAAGTRLLADAAALPLANGSVDCAVLVNALLFPAEIDRVVAPGGRVVWVNTRGTDTPIHLPPEDVAAALPGGWSGVAATAGLGLWTVVGRDA
jgi:SAM-dependent methyltransferase